MPIVPLPESPEYTITSNDVKKLFNGRMDHKVLHTMIQFVPGICGHSVTEPFHEKYSSGDGKANEANINSIMAKPHISANSELNFKATVKKRYYPLMRGMVDVPTPGDPVLLCKIGDTQYYLGPLNTDNNTNYNLDPYMNDQVLESPSTAEKGQSGLKDKSFFQTRVGRLHKVKNPPLDFPLNDPDQFISNNTSPDMVFEGRHGNSIRLGSRNINPYLIISNGRTPLSNNGESSLDNSVFALFKHGSIRQHFQLDQKKKVQEGSTLEKLSPYQFTLADDEIADVYKSISKTFKKNIGRGVQETGEDDLDIEKTIYSYGEKADEGQAFLSSDRITFNARKDSIFLAAYKFLHMGSGNSMTFSTSNNILFESQTSSITNTKLFKVNSDIAEIDGRDKITLGSPSLDQMQRAVLGDNLLMTLDILISDIQTALMACSAAIEQRTKVGASLNIMQKEVDSIEKTREMMKNIILSNKVYLKP